MASIDLSKIQQSVETIAEQLGIDINAYGNASPTKIVIEVLKSAVTILQQTAKIALTEQNPLTATELKSRLGLAALVGLNPEQLLTAAIGKVKVFTNGHTVTIAQHAKLYSYQNIPYYVVLPNETVTFSDDTELQVRQGELKVDHFTLSGEHWQSHQLSSVNFIDVNSIEVYKDNERLSVGFKLDEQADVYIRCAYDGTTEVIVGKTLKYEVGESLTVQYAECLGIDGDNIEAGQKLKVSEFAYEGNADITSDVDVYISEPIIGGTDFAEFDNDLANEIMLGGHNNLIGTEAQLKQYVKRFKQYTIQSAKVTEGVFVVTAIRSLKQLCKTMSYWIACEELTLRSQDILALNSHLNNYAKKSLDLLIEVKAAVQEQCMLNIELSMNNASFETVMSVVQAYLLSRLDEGTYEVGELYKALLALDDVKECNVSFTGYLNKYGTAIPSTADAILICTAAKVNINGITKTYGSFDISTISAIDEVVTQVTEDRIVDINKEAYKS